MIKFALTQPRYLSSALVRIQLKVLCLLLPFVYPSRGTRSYLSAMFINGLVERRVHLSCPVLLRQQLHITDEVLSDGERGLERIRRVQTRIATEAQLLPSANIEQ